jgi:hypothetical protein
VFHDENCSTWGTYTLGSAGLYYARVRRYTGDAIGAYTVWVDMPGGTDLDGGTKATAFDTSNLSGAPYTAVSTEFDAGNDVDWYRFSAVAGEQWTISTFDLASSVDTVISVYDADDSGMAYGGSHYILMDDDGGMDHNYASSLIFTAPRDGYYYVKVAEYSSYNAGRYGIVFLANGVASLSPPEFP